MTDSDLWEGLIIRILNQNNDKDLYLCNIYRPPRGNITNDVLLNFTEDINNIISSLDKSKSIIALLGDFNINLLQYNDSPVIKEYLNNIISLDMYPAITLPTRLIDCSATLIDNIFCNHYHDKLTSAGILLSDLSDHFPYFFILSDEIDYRNNCEKNIYYCKYDDESKRNLYEALDRIDIISHLSEVIQSNPNINYNILENIITENSNKFFPLSKRKVHKYKHKRTEWITTGLMKSIKFRDA
jgi:hypothetical protein